MSKHCLGCGIMMQSIEAAQPGYSPKEDALYCKRCFRLTNYGEFNIVHTEGINNEVILNKLSTVEGTILWIIDLFDLEASLSLDNLNYFRNKPVIVVLSKHDLFPKTMTEQRVMRYVKYRLKKENFNVLLIYVNHIKKNGEAVFEEIVEVVEQWPVYVVGMANVGKSTFINQLATNQILTVSRHPNTTLEFNALTIRDYIFIDTPGLNQLTSLLSVVTQDDLRYIIPTSPIKPKIYQVYEDQSFALGGLIRVDLKCHKLCSIVFYMSDYIPVHRGKLENSDVLWKQHYGGLLIPKTNELFENYQTMKFISTKDYIEIAITGLGWLKIEGRFEEMVIHYPNKVVIKERVGFESC